MKHIAFLFLMLAPAAQAATIVVTDDTPARAISITNDGHVVVTAFIYTMAQCKQALEENAEEFKAHSNAILCVPADMSAEGSVRGDLPLIDLTK
ncbi:hypothetical protein HJA76_09795 [Rhizobium bangladeshense]|uniref:hypothetical protein n=1 Tax=Rhizobium bangladeshense TaxID=1138189 RepID=UPI001C82B8A4|nr:hypothetical protein [Rhizobium bangladeshense]MBX4920000.1 hypothetical protein [Rhizobium bangladeshense]